MRISDWSSDVCSSDIPAVDGGIVALYPQTGRVLALVGGFSPHRSEFNRAHQARRQPGPAFTPFVSPSEPDLGIKPSKVIMGAPSVCNQGTGRGLWLQIGTAARMGGGCGVGER